MRGTLITTAGRSRRFTTAFVYQALVVAFAFFVVILVIYWLTKKPEHPYEHVQEQRYERLLKREAELADEFQRKTKMVDVKLKPPETIGSLPNSQGDRSE